MRSGPLERIVLAALLCSALLAPGATAAAAASEPTPSSATPSVLVTASASKNKVTSKKAKHKAIEKEILRLVNKHRERKGLDRLARSSKITKVARSWSVKQAKKGRLAHNPSYARQIPAGWTRASENVARTTARGSAKKLAKRMVKLWMGSAGHRANILGPYTRRGVGVAYSARHGWYFTQNFSD